jgi:hypothetical protein
MDSHVQLKRATTGKEIRRYKAYAGQHAPHGHIRAA